MEVGSLVSSTDCFGVSFTCIEREGKVLKDHELHHNTFGNEIVGIGHVTYSRWRSGFVGMTFLICVNKARENK